MKVIRPETKNEEKLIKGIQKVNGSKQDGLIGNQTLSDIAIKLNADCFPVTLDLFGMPCIISNDILPFTSPLPLRSFKNSMIGSFTYPRATTPCSILISNGKVIFDQSCRNWAGYPEAVIYKRNGEIKHGEFRNTNKLQGCDWAVGGFGLMDLWNPAGQGFKVINGVDYYTSTTYKTNHNVLGIKNGKIFGVLCKNMNAIQINDFCKNVMQFDFAIKLDGGGLGAINGDESFAKINTNVKCGYAIQFI